ncbi:hypothetical protein KKF38_01215 [Patescibacteria group bacterium]|nr:hypothetical protein [Patescibacteria group bacterium]
MTELFRDKYRIPSARLKGWDYAADGYYFVTVYTKDHEEFFGEVVNKKMALSGIGKIVDEEWREAEEIRGNVELDVWVTMPNHIHGILIINNFRKRNAGIVKNTGVAEMQRVETRTIEMQRVETHCNARSQQLIIGACSSSRDITDARSRDVARNVSTIKNKFSKISPKPNSLSVIIRSFKSAVTKRVHEIQPALDCLWQPRFHDRVIRDEEELNRIRNYIFLNPDNWEKDKENLEINFCA